MDIWGQIWKKATGRSEIRLWVCTVSRNQIILSANTCVTQNHFLLGTTIQTNAKIQENQATLPMVNQIVNAGHEI